MAIDISTEALISLRDASRLLPARRRGKRPHLSCMYRWTTVGCRGVVLESLNVGGTRCTSREALARFIERLSVADDRMGGRGEMLLPRRHDPERVARELDAEGIRGA
jgi:hypothetical protein